MAKLKTSVKVILVTIIFCSVLIYISGSSHAELRSLWLGGLIVNAVIVLLWEKKRTTFIGLEILLFFTGLSSKLFYDHSVWSGGADWQSTGLILGAGIACIVAMYGLVLFSTTLRSKFYSPQKC
jgi:hypothetical protein